MIKALRNFFLQCPYLDEMAKVNVDYLGPNAVEYTIDSVPGTEIIKKYTNGDAIKQYNFVFGSKEFYGPDALQNLENTGFYEKVSRWLRLKTDKNELPDLGSEREVISVEALSNGYLFHADEDRARYQIQCRLVYYEKKIRG